MTDERPGVHGAAERRAETARRLRPGSTSSPALDRLAALAARLLRTGAAQIALTGDVSTRVGSSGVLPSTALDTPLAESLSAHTAAQGRPLIVNDARLDPRWAELPAVRDGVVGSYLGVPVSSDDATVVGALCVFDAGPRLWAQPDIAMLEALAQAAGTELELAALTRDFDASRARWDLAIEAAGVGSFDWDLRTGRLSWDGTLVEMFGYGDDEVFQETIEAFNARLHPTDLPGVTQALQHAIDTVGEYEAEYRVLLPDGTTRQIQARGRALGDEHGSHRLLGAAWDVSATRGSEDRAARIVEAMPVAYVRVDADGVVTGSNGFAERLLGRHRSDLIGTRLSDAIPPAGRERLRQLSARSMTEQSSAVEELFLDQPVGAWLELRMSPDSSGLSIFFTDITERRAERERVEQMAAHDRSVARTMQDALLTRLPQRADLELHARYVTAAEGDRVGGDWFDALVQPNGATTLVVGDVVGHDITAAATMGQLRSMLRAFIWQSDDTPAQVLTHLDQAICDLYPGAFATAVTVRLEETSPAGAGRRTARWTNAGHPPPLVVLPDGTVQVLATTPALLLGVMTGVSRADAAVDLPIGSTLVLYTDGLIERRDRDILTGIDLLVAAVQRHRDLSVEDLLDSVLTEMLDGSIEDDVVMFAVRLR